jgi:hypothetical protein
MDANISSITGEHDLNETRTIIYPFERYEIEVQLTPDGKFIGISQVKISKDFLSHLQRQSSIEVLDVEKYYREAEKD